MQKLELMKKKKLKLVGKKDMPMVNKVFKMVKTVPLGMTKFQIRNFVLGDREFPTIDSKYWQCKLELWVRLQSLVQLHYDYYKARAMIKLQESKIEEYEQELNNSPEPFMVKRLDAKRELAEIEIERNEFKMLTLEKMARDKLEEMQVFYNAYDELKKCLKHSSENKEEQEEEFWRAKAKIDERLMKRHFGGDQSDKQG